MKFCSGVSWLTSTHPAVLLFHRLCPVLPARLMWPFWMPPGCSPEEMWTLVLEFPKQVELWGWFSCLTFVFLLDSTCPGWFWSHVCVYDFWNPFSLWYILYRLTFTCSGSQFWFNFTSASKANVSPQKAPKAWQGWGPVHHQSTSHQQVSNLNRDHGCLWSFWATWVHPL